MGIKELINVMKDKKFTNVISSGSNEFDFGKLRMSVSTEGAR
jgi:hypothetical protein